MAYLYTYSKLHEYLIKMMNDIGSAHNLCLYFNYERESSHTCIKWKSEMEISQRRRENVKIYFFSVFYYYIGLMYKICFIIFYLGFFVNVN
jgi:hypothetical protein